MDDVVYEPKRALGAIDRVLIRGAAAHKSGKELSALTNGVVSAAAAMARVLEITDERDWLTEARMRMLLIDDLMELKDELRRRAIDNQNLDAARPLIATLQTIAKLLSDNKMDLAKAMSQISHAHAQMMMAATRLQLEMALFELQKRHPEIDWGTEMREVYLASIPQSVREIESHIGSD